LAKIGGPKSTAAYHCKLDNRSGIATPGYRSIIVPLIEFHTKPEFLGKIPEPFPASRAVPDWIKHLPIDREGEPTIKRCAPFLQAVTAGYIIPVPFDIQFACSPEGEVSFQWTPMMPQRHLPSQQIGTPFAAAKIIKFINPWMVKTPPGYSTLFIRPFNRFDCPFIPLTGIVETDTYIGAVQLPSISQMPPNSSYTLPRGAPLVQIVPILRESWTSTAQVLDDAQLQKSTEAYAENQHLYKHVNWRKMEYG
jgi:hypothetical protein